MLLDGALREIETRGDLSDGQPLETMKNEGVPQRFGESIKNFLDQTNVVLRHDVPFLIREGAAKNIVTGAGAIVLVAP